MTTIKQELPVEPAFRHCLLQVLHAEPRGAAKRRKVLAVPGCRLVASEDVRVRRKPTSDGHSGFVVVPRRGAARPADGDLGLLLVHAVLVESTVVAVQKLDQTHPLHGGKATTARMVDDEAFVIVNG